MFHQVLGEIAFRFSFECALIAMEWLHPSVFFHVCCQIHFQCCLIITLVTFVWFLSSVGACVLLEVDILFEICVATSAGKFAYSVLDMFNRFVLL